MKKTNDGIIFENRKEIENIMIAINNYVRQNPKEKSNKGLEKLFNLLDVMFMEW